MTSHIVLSSFPHIIPVGEVFIALIVRLVVGYGILTLAYYHLTRGKAHFAHDLGKYLHGHSSTIVILAACGEIVIAVLLIVGLYTQIAALLASILFIKILFLSKQLPHMGFESRRYHWTLLILSAALILTGSGGYFSFDYPL